MEPPENEPAIAEPLSVMLILHVGMKKSGSAWFYRMASDVAEAAGYPRAADVRERSGLQTVIREKTDHVNGRNPLRLARLLLASRRTGPFLVTTHRAGSYSTGVIARAGLIRVVLSYRDPFDVVVSLMDHGRRAREKGNRSDHASVTDVRTALDYLEPYLAEWSFWAHRAGTLAVRYEDLLADAPAELGRLRDWLGIDVADDRLRDIASRYSAQAIVARDEPFERFHLATGGNRRHTDVLTAEELRICRERIGGLRAAMGY